MTYGHTGRHVASLTPDHLDLEEVRRIQQGATSEAEEDWDVSASLGKGPYSEVIVTVPSQLMEVTFDYLCEFNPERIGEMLDELERLRELCTSSGS